MSSKRRIEASRRNGALSKGPKTAAGKSRSSQNALKHGILSERVVLTIEDKDNFDAALDHYIDKFDPQDGVEMGFVEQMASLFWRMQRSITIEKEIFDKALENHTQGLEERCLGEAFMDLAGGTSLKSIQRYESMLDRMHTRALRNLLLMRKMQPDNPQLPNEPSPKTGHSKTCPPHPPETRRQGRESEILTKEKVEPEALKQGQPETAVTPGANRASAAPRRPVDPRRAAPEPLSRPISANNASEIARNVGLTAPLSSLLAMAQGCR
jgi:hypothetical protein